VDVEARTRKEHIAETRANAITFALSAIVVAAAASTVNSPAFADENVGHRDRFLARRFYELPGPLADPALPSPLLVRPTGSVQPGTRYPTPVSAGVPP